MNKIREYFKKRSNYDILAFFLAAIVIMISFSLGQRMFFSKFVIMESDMLAAYVPFYKMFMNKIFVHGDLFGAGKLFYSYQVYMGMDISAHFCGESVISPVTLLYCLIDDINLASIFVVIIKYSLAAFFFQRFERRVLGVDGFASCVFSLFYALCGYNIAYYCNLQFMEGIYMLPVIITLCYEFVENKKKGLPLAIAYWYLFVTCVYTAYIVGIVSCIYFILVLCTSNLNKKERIYRFLNYAKYVVIAAAIGAFTLLPAAIFLLTHMASDASQFTGIPSGPIAHIGNAYLGMMQNRDGLIPYIYSGLMSLIMIPYFFISKEIKKRDKIVWGTMLGYMILCMIVPFLYMFMHCFDAPDMFCFRYAFILSFVAVAIAAKTFNAHKKVNIKVIGITSAVWIVMYMVVYMYESKVYTGEMLSASMFGLELNAIFLIVYAFMLNKKNNAGTNSGISGLILTIMIAEVALNAYFGLISTKYTGISYKAILNEVSRQYDSCADEIKDKDNGIYRIWSKNIPTWNYQMINDTYGIDSFSSAENEQLRKTFTALGCFTSPRILSDYGAMEFVKMIFGEKYNIYSNGVVVDNMEEGYYEENPYTLPLGYMTSSDISNVHFGDNDYNAFENINTVASAMLGTECYPMRDAGLELSLTLDNMTGYQDENGMIIFEPEDKSQDAFVFCECESNPENLYFYLPQSSSVLTKEGPIVYSEGGDLRILMNQSYADVPHIVRMGKNDEGKYNVIFAIKSNSITKQLSIGDSYLFTADDDELVRAYDELSRNPFNITTFEDGYVCGDIEATNEKDTFFMTIPYDKNWTLKVDGKDTKIVPALNDTFISAKLTPGKHNIVLEYKNKWITIGSVISLLGILCLIVCYKLDCRIKEQKEANDEVA